MLTGDSSFCSHGTCETCSLVLECSFRGRAWPSDVTSVGSLHSLLLHVYFICPPLAWCSPDRHSPFTSTFMHLTSLLLPSVSPPARIKGQFPLWIPFPSSFSATWNHHFSFASSTLPFFWLFHPCCSSPSLLFIFLK